MSDKIIPFNGTAARDLFADAERELAEMSKSPWPTLDDGQVLDLLVRTYEHADLLELEEYGKVRPVHCPRSSDLYPLCRRRLFYSIIDWQSRPAFNVNTRRAFRGGKLGHNIARADLMRLLGPHGWTFDRLMTEQSREIEWRGRVVMTHTPDAVLLDPSCKHHILVEIKTTDTFTVRRFETFDDIMQHAWFRRYVSQVYLNAWSLGLERGFFYLTDNRRERKMIPFSIDADAALEQIEAVLTVCFDVVMAVEQHRQGKNVEPPADCTDPKGCEHCWLKEEGKCPGIMPSGDDLPIETDPEMISTLEWLGGNRVVGEKYRHTLDHTKKHYSTAFRDRPEVPCVLTPVCPIVLKRKRKTGYDLPTDIAKRIDELKAPHKFTDPNGVLEVVFDWPEGDDDE